MWGESGEFIQGVQNAAMAENKSQTFVDFFGPKK
jgi:hypothetical protein